jgi:hypothetical protein
MRRILILLICIAATPALTQEWGRYENMRFGYALDIPPGFTASAPPPANGDGQVFSTADGAELRVWGANVREGFPVEFDAMVSTAVSEGWDVSIPAGFAADAAFEGQMDDRRVAVHAINYCGGALMAAFQLSTAAGSKAAMIPVIARLSRSLSQADGFMCP